MVLTFNLTKSEIGGFYDIHMRIPFAVVEIFSGNLQLPSKLLNKFQGGKV